MRIEVSIMVFESKPEKSVLVGDLFCTIVNVEAKQQDSFAIVEAVCEEY